jgi:hypothetical protein
MPQRPVDASNSILVSGQPIIEEYEVQTATDMYPGRAVITGTTSRDIIVAPAASVVVLGVLDTKPGALRGTCYTQYDQARVIRGDCVVMMLCEHAATITVGQKIEAYSTNDGKIGPYTTVNAEIGLAEEAHAAGAADGWVMVKLTRV